VGVEFHGFEIEAENADDRVADALAAGAMVPDAGAAHRIRQSSLLVDKASSICWTLDRGRAG
jgi:hypothetical protein